MEIKFPSDFLWGTAISSYQCEGGNYNSDWYLWEKTRKLQPAGAGCGHYHRFREDFSLAKSLNSNALRFSLEWSRICPEPGVFLREEIEHYHKVFDSLKKNNLKPLVTLHHFSNPIWFVNRGGWMNPKNIDFFLEFVKKSVEEFKEKAEYWLIINEPLVYIYNGFIRGIWPPGHKSLVCAHKVLKNMRAAYLDGYREIKNIYKDSTICPKVSLARHLRKFSPCQGPAFLLNCLGSHLRNKFFNFSLLDDLAKRGALDFIGLNYYCIDYTHFTNILGGKIRPEPVSPRRNQLGWYIDPRGFYDVLISLKKFGLPVIITENGTAETEDPLYEDYLISHLQALAKAYSQGVNVAGYLWWSLLDNFEWAEGFKAKFGLIEVDYKTQKRKCKPFSRNYAKICRDNKILLSDE